MRPTSVLPSSSAAAGSRPPKAAAPTGSVAPCGLCAPRRPAAHARKPFAAARLGHNHSAPARLTAARSAVADDPAAEAAPAEWGISIEGVTFAVRLLARPSSVLGSSMLG